MRTSMTATLAVTTLLVLLAVSLGVTTPAHADDVDGNVTGGDVNYAGNTVPPEVQAQARMKGQLAALHRARKNGEAGADRAFDDALRSYEARYGELATAARDGQLATLSGRGTSGGGEMSAASFDWTKKILPVAHYGQINGYFCGPGSGKMILKFLNEGLSAYNGASQDQDHIGGSAHMRTWINGKTGWTSGLFRIGLNRWRGGEDWGWYLDIHDPTVSGFKDALAFDIDYGMPFGADTVEFAGGTHYNGHPNNKTIGHWIVVHGYIDTGSETKFADPSTSVWPEVNKHFRYGTHGFVTTFLNNNGITW